MRNFQNELVAKTPYSVGLTKLEYTAIAIAAGLTERYTNPFNLAEAAVSLAEAILDRCEQRGLEERESG